MPPIPTRRPAPLRGPARPSVGTGPRLFSRLLWAAATVSLCGAMGVSAWASGRSHSYSNPILWGDYSDPDVIRSGRSYYLVASSFHFSPGIPVLKSDDLVHWRIVGHVLARLPFAPEYDLPGPVPTDDAGRKTPREQHALGQRYAGGAWAPSIREHAGRFYVYFATPDEGVFVSTASWPEGPWSPPVAVIPGPGLEDPCPFWDDDGRAYLIHGRVGAGPLVLHRMSSDGMHVLDAGSVVAEDPRDLPVMEGPKLYKRGRYYYIFTPVGGVEKGWQAVLRSRSIYGPYAHREVLAQGSTGVQGPHQGGWVQTPSGQGWFIHFNSTGGYGRIDYLEPLSWRDGWPLIGDPIPGRPGEGRPVKTHTAPDTGAWRPRVRPQTSDDFSSTALGLQWEWNHNPDDHRWSLSVRPGWLRLSSAPARDLVSARNTLTQAQQSPASTVTTRLDAGSMTDAQRAGLAMFGKGVSWIGVVQASGLRRVSFARDGREEAGPPLTGRIVQLRLSIAGGMVRYAYSLDDGRNFTNLGTSSPFVFSWWKGARPALFTYNAPGFERPGAADFDWVHVTPVVEAAAR